jgi:carboxymethylenebutenolidase
MGEMIDLVASDAGTMRAYRALPSSGRGPAVIVLQEIFGVNAAMRSVADDLAAQGYAAFVPDLFWRAKPGVELGYDEAGVQEAFGLWKQFDIATGVADVVATVATVRAMPETDGKVALLGFCLGGQLAVRAGAAAKPDAVISFYGTALGTALDEIRLLDCPTIFHFGDADQHVPPEVHQPIAAIAADKPEMDVHLYAGAGHAFFNSFRPQGFDAAAQASAWDRTLTLLDGAFARSDA